MATTSVPFRFATVLYLFEPDKDNKSDKADIAKGNLLITHTYAGCLFCCCVN